MEKLGLAVIGARKMKSLHLGMIYCLENTVLTEISEKDKLVLKIGKKYLHKLSCGAFSLKDSTTLLDSLRILNIVLQVHHQMINSKRTWKHSDNSPSVIK